MAEGRSTTARWIRGIVRLLWRPVLIVAFTGALAAWILGWEIPDRTIEPPRAQEVVVAPAKPERRWTPRETKRPTPGCLPQAERVCIQGDAWWLDSCGTAYEKAQECGRTLCEGGACEPEDPPDCGGLPAIGECDHEVARMCNAGRPVEVDCGGAGMRCVMSEEGPMCRVPTDDDCNDPPGVMRCEGPELVACVEGVTHRLDCRTRGGSCGPLAGGLRMGCIVEHPNPAQTCGACGCPADKADEACDGVDNDHDGYIDEDDNCGEVDIVAFVVETESGDSSFSDEDVQRELRRINEAFAREDDYGLTFRLADIIALRRSEWLSIDDQELDQIVGQGLVHPEREDFYVPMLFTDELEVGGVPRPGLSTGPNGFCGRMRRTPHPQSPVGLVAIAKRRWATTAAHELGHFFGLCHTHGDVPGAEHAFDSEAGHEEVAACAEPCTTEADGICDTPSDPGPAVCAITPECTAACTDGQTPDPANIMGYYPSCRAHFSEEQMLLVRATLHQRRSWHPCIWGDGCDCDPLAPECPESMTCRNFKDGADATKWRCGMEGASVVAAPCSSTLDCSDHSICISTPSTGGRCVRPCTPATPNCDCQQIESFEIPLCMSDFEAGQ